MKKERDFYIDRIRVVMTALVILHHTAITYGASGGWFYHEVAVSNTASSILLTSFCTINQAFFMGFFFLLAGYYTPISFDKKGYRRYLTDRFIRLGIPLVVFALVLAPLTIWLARLRDHVSFWDIVEHLWERRHFEQGPLWFAFALMIFALGYCLWRALQKPRATSARAQVPPNSSWFFSALGVGACALIIRQFVPVGENIFGLQLGYFASYVFLFAIGILAKRGDWFSRLSEAQARQWAIVSLLLSPILPLAILMSRAYHLNIGTFVGGLSFSSVLYAFWEPFFAWGVIAGLLVWFRLNANSSSATWNYLGRRAFLVYIIHPPIVVSVSVLLQPWSGPALLKFVVAGTVSVFGCWLVAEPLIKIPGVQRIV